MAKTGAQRSKEWYYRYHERELEKRRTLMRNKVLDPVIYDKMFKEQDGRCYLCEKKKPYRLAVDHNHRTGDIRRLLCNACNAKIGWFECNRVKITDYVDDKGGE